MSNKKPDVSAVRSIKDRIAEIFENRAREERERTAAIEKAREELAEIQARIDNAVVTGDTTAYTNAKREKALQDDVVEMNEKRLQQFRDSALVSAEEYEEGVKMIEAEMKARVLADKKRIIELMEEIRDIAGADRDALNEANKVLHDWQFRVNKLADMPLNDRGDRIINFRTQKQLRDFIIAQYAAYIIDCGYYENICKDCGEPVKKFDDTRRLII